MYWNFRNKCANISFYMYTLYIQKLYLHNKRRRNIVLKTYTNESMHVSVSL